VSSPEPEQRRTILDAALAVLAREGEAAFTVRNIAGAAGCSTTGVYTWFGGKAGLVDAIFVEGFESFDAALEPAYVAGDTAGSGRAYRRWALANPTHFLVMFGRAVPDVRPGAEALARGLESFQRLVDHVRAVRPDLSEADAFDWAYHLNATVHGYVLTELTGMSTAPHRAEELFELGLARVVEALELGRPC
jgi:AcrR family transcriptional regulator